MSVQKLTDIIILLIQAEAALTREEPVLREMVLPGRGVQHGVDVADPCLLGTPHLQRWIFCNEMEKMILEHELFFFLIICRIFPPSTSFSAITRSSRPLNTTVAVGTQE